jgi:hypothetical protein
MHDLKSDPELKVIADCVNAFSNLKTLHEMERVADYLNSRMSAIIAQAASTMLSP